MISVKGTIKGGMVLPLEPVKESDEGRNVIIMFVDDDQPQVKTAAHKNGKRTLEELIEECQVDTGISDLASQHDHYLYGKLKK